jgi:hypothetical protein
MRDLLSELTLRLHFGAGSRAEPALGLASIRSHVEWIDPWCRCCFTFHKFGEPIEKRPLAFKNFDMRSRKVEPRGAINLGKGLHLSTLRRPFDLEKVALDGIDVEVAFGSECDDLLAPALADVAERLKLVRDGVTCLSRNSRRAALAASSPSSISPLGIDQAPSSLLRQNGPPG